MTLQAQQFTPTSYKGILLSKDNMSELIIRIKEENAALATKADKAPYIRNLILLSQFSRANLDYSASFDYAGEALFMAEESQNTELLYTTHQEYGLINYLFKQDKAAHLYLKLALKYAKQAFSERKIQHQELLPAYYNYLIYLQRTEDYKTMEAYIDTCKSFVEQYNLGVEKDVYLLEKTAFLKYNQHHYDESFALLEKARTLIIDHKLERHHSFLIVILGIMGDHYRSLGNTEKALANLAKALKVEDVYGEHTFYLEYLHTVYARMLNQQGASKEAYRHMVLAKEINDQYLNPRKDATQDLISVKDRYREELNNKNEHLQQQAIEIAEQKTKLWQIRVFFFIFIFLVTVSLLLILRKRQKQKQEKEIKDYRERRKHNEALIEHKNKELTSNMLQLIEKEEIISQLKEVLENEVAPNKTKSLFKSIEQQSAKLWEDFNKRFMEQNTEFYNKLQKHAPNLSAADLKVCALIKLNFSGKEMAYLLGISEGSVHVARHRLRKKLDLGRDVNLVQFINGL